MCDLPLVLARHGEAPQRAAGPKGHTGRTLFSSRLQRSGSRAGGGGRQDHSTAALYSCAAWGRPALGSHPGRPRAECASSHLPAWLQALPCRQQVVLPCTYSNWNCPSRPPRTGCNIQDELFVSFDNLIALADKRGSSYDRRVRRWAVQPLLAPTAPYILLPFEVSPFLSGDLCCR